MIYLYLYKKDRKKKRKKKGEKKGKGILSAFYIIGDLSDSFKKFHSMKCLYITNTFPRYLE